MKYGISGAPVPTSLRYADPINRAAADRSFSPMLAYAVFYRETIHGEVIGLWNAATVIAPDGGHGLGQITPPWNPVPPDWQDPYVNATASIGILQQALDDWANLFSGDTLIRVTAATYNAGYGNALRGHLAGNVDLYTTGENYAANVLAFYNLLAAGGVDLEAVAV